MSHAPVLAFDEPLRGEGGSGATEQIAQVLHESGVDVPASLYDEALALAQEGRLAPAAERLRMLLVLDSSDADAALLLGKVLAGRGQWQEALAQLDSAAAKGARLPRGLRDEVERQLRRKVHDAEEHRARVAARERGEVRTLRQEARRLRSESAVFEQQIEDLERRVKIWSSATAIVAGSAAALLLAAMLFGGPSADEAAAPAVVDVVEAPSNLPPPVAAPVEAPPAAPAAVTPPPMPKPSPKPAPGSNAKPAQKSTPAPGQRPRSEATGTVTHTVQKGETLGHIARKYYGKSSAWKRILAANQETLPSEKALRPGMKLKIPRG